MLRQEEQSGASVPTIQSPAVTGLSFSSLLSMRSQELPWLTTSISQSLFLIGRPFKERHVGKESRPDSQLLQSFHQSKTQELQEACLRFHPWKKEKGQERATAQN